MDKIVHWIIPDNAEEFVRTVLSREADDIPEEKINTGTWEYAELLIDQISVNKEMMQDHDVDPVHIKRCDDFIETINKGNPIFPLIVLGKELFLVDGYARYRALKRLGLQSVEVIMQKFD